ncbi:MAG: hypothetical protein MAG453_01913 [Calditrichaeota bacterium]|nr:hypothetical protein [Calditrichota bacterium]
MIHERAGGLRVNPYGRWSRVVALDGLLLICRASLMLDMPPSAGDRDHFHGYDLALSLAAHARGLKNWTIPLVLVNASGGVPANDERYLRDRAWFERPFADSLPVSVPFEPPPGLGG